MLDFYFFQSSVLATNYSTHTALSTRGEHYRRLNESSVRLKPVDAKEECIGGRTRRKPVLGGFSPYLKSNEGQERHGGSSSPCRTSNRDLLLPPGSSGNASGRHHRRRKGNQPAGAVDTRRERACPRQERDKDHLRENNMKSNKSPNDYPRSAVQGFTRCLFGMLGASAEEGGAGSGLFVAMGPASASAISTSCSGSTSTPAGASWGGCCGHVRRSRHLGTSEPAVGFSGAAAFAAALDAWCATARRIPRRTSEFFVVV